MKKEEIGKKRIKSKEKGKRVRKENCCRKRKKRRKEEQKRGNIII